ncbi:hypothetical protein B2J88_45545 [Rhodococcus sp. SRB_17]|uniref:glycosyltransferase n=1 Tax=Acidovorax sp. SRB_24 TaxID=1962700 RepID=UPI00145E5CE7|nr:hypothetical protein [Acidovorax sp. SRB_24]NMM75348.1 hypothetical protein [Acidovorax sp. SRB_24]NMM91488.1 hypothetical protein [Rhodococcus sp. SRB_17]
MTAANLKVGFVLLSHSRNPQPSTRIAVLNMLPALREAGIEAELVFDPEQSSETPDLGHLAQRLINARFDVIYFQKVRGESAERCARALKKAGIATIYGVCDLVDADMAMATNMTLVVSEFLKSLYPPALQPKIHVVHDGIEKPSVVKADVAAHTGSRSKPIRAVLVTSSSLTSLPVLAQPPNWLEVTIVGKYPPRGATAQKLREARWAFLKMSSANERLAYLRFLVNARIKTQMWQAESVYAALQCADIGIIPVEPSAQLVKGTHVPVWKVKSENRLTLKMSVGLPVIATPIPSYEPIIESGVNAFFADTRRDWIRCLEILRDPAVRRSVGAKARTSVVDRFSQTQQARLLVAALRAVSESRGVFAELQPI